MKRLFLILIIAAVLSVICGCSKTSIDQDAGVTLTFIYADKDICVKLDDEEAEMIIDILDGNNYDPVFAGIPSCGFDENVSLTVGDRVFAIACDNCNCIMDFGNKRFFDIPKEDMEYIRTLFENYGGYFPCV